ncbi:MAG: hypothetical protein EZS28_024541 [Streblomastix strix]|uniref:Uncharacterized protein n=1 Tax=Streblomastix strix TaxID=222440 RepID=A0A5J4VBM6_9EUKA|nr:MAG: hypothetical protein EZS28_024541 [Streblomastix strix]
MPIDNIKAMYMTFVMNQYLTWFFPVLLQMFDLIIDQRHLVSEAYASPNPMACGQIGSKATKVYYPNKFMLDWKMATDNSFMRGYNSSKMGARTNVQVILQGSLTPGINENSLINPGENQNNHLTVCGTRCHPNPRTAQITTLMNYLCDVTVRVTFDDAPDPQVLTLQVIGELGGAMVRAG